jgi:hypothetical protein
VLPTLPVEVRYPHADDKTDGLVCNCLHGSCTSSGNCTCAAGYVINTTSTDKKCAQCAIGYFSDVNDNCLGRSSDRVEPALTLQHVLLDAHRARCAKERPILRLAHHASPPSRCQPPIQLLASPKEAATLASTMTLRLRPVVGEAKQSSGKYGPANAQLLTSL